MGSRCYLRPGWWRAVETSAIFRYEMWNTYLRIACMVFVCHGMDQNSDKPDEHDPKAVLEIENFFRRNVVEDAYEMIDDNTFTALAKSALEFYNCHGPKMTKAEMFEWNKMDIADQ